jgi:hypothetical protein
MLNLFALESMDNPFLVLLTATGHMASVRSRFTMNDAVYSKITLSRLVLCPFSCRALLGLDGQVRFVTPGVTGLR